MKIFDAHGDIWCDVFKKRSMGETHVIKNHHLDKFKKGNIMGGIFIVWVDTPFDHEHERMLNILGTMQDELSENADDLLVVKNFHDFSVAEQKNQLPIILGVEGFDGFNGDINYISTLYDMGFRHASLTWNYENPFATGVKGDPDRGLTPLGVEALKVMEEKGMIIDVTHANEKTFWDIEKNSTGIFIASHSNAKALCDVPRNLTDDQIRAIAERNGFIGAVSYHEFISSKKENRNIEHYVDQIEYLVELAGIDHVGMGFDFVDYLNDDALSTFSDEDMATDGLSNATQARHLVDLLRNRGYRDSDIEKICNGNFMRIIKTVVG